MVEQGRADEEALLMALQAKAAAVDDQLASFVDAHLDIVLDALLVRFVDHRAVMSFRIGRNSDAQLFDRRDHLFAERRSGIVADGDDNRQGHAALACGAERGAGQVVDHLIEVGVRQDDAMVLGAAERLHPLPVRSSARVDILRNVGRADEADAGDVRMVEDRVDHFLVAVDDVEQAVWKACFLH